MLGKLTMTFATLTLTGCLGGAPYHPPKDGEPSATLVIRNTGEYFPNFWISLDAQHCDDVSSDPSMSRIAPGTESSIKIRAGQDISIGGSLLLDFGIMSWQCDEIATFHPQAAGRYIALFHKDKSSGCTLVVADEIENQGVMKLVPEPSFRPRKTNSRSMQRPSCQ